MTLINKYDLKSKFPKRFFIQRIFIKDEDWMPSELFSYFQKIAAKFKIDIDDDHTEWNEWGKEDGRDAWTAEFHGMDEIMADRQRERPQEFDPDEQGMVIVVFYVDLSKGEIFKLETEAVS